MQPNRINAMLDSSRRLSDDEPTAAFLVAWAAWEAYLDRVMEVALQFQGLSSDGAWSIIDERKTWRRQNREAVLTSLLGGRNPSSLPVYGKLWQGLHTRPSAADHRERKAVSSNAERPRSFEGRRHELVHGRHPARPSTLRTGVRRINEAVTLPMFGNVAVPVLTGDSAGATVELGNVLSARRGDLGSRRDSATVEDVRRAFGWTTALRADSE